MALLQRVEVWSSYACNSGTRTAIVGEPIRVEGSETLDGDDKIVVAMYADDQAAQYCVARKVIRLQFDDATFTEWRIRTTQTEMGDDGSVLTVTATSPLLDLADATIISETQSSGVVDFDIGVAQATITEVINTYILALPEFTSGGEYDYFALGTIDPTAKYDVNWTKATPLALLRELCLAARDTTTKKPAELRVRRNGTTSYLIDVLTEIGSTAAVVDLRSKKNVRDNSLTLETDEQYTKIYAFGADDGSGVPSTIARAAFTLDNLSTLTYEITDPEGGPSPVLENDQLNGMYVVPNGTGALVQITDSAAGSPATVTLASTTGITEGEQHELRANSSDKLNTFLTSPSAVTTYGTKVGTVDREDLFGTRNLVKNPWLRTWTTAANPPDDWSLSSNAFVTVSQNTDSLYTEYGGKSWKFEIASSANGNFSATSATFYPRAVNGSSSFSLKVHLFVGVFSGDCLLELRVEDPSANSPPIAQKFWVPTNFPIANSSDALPSGDWVDIGFEGIDCSAALTTGLRVHLLGHNFGNIVHGGVPGTMTVYLDAVMFTQTPKVPSIWIEYSGANALWHAANLALSTNKDPLESYEAEIDDLTRADGTAFPHTALTMGGDVRLTIPEQGIAESALRLIGKPLIDYLVPKRTRIELASRRRLLASLLGGRGASGGATVGVVGGGGGSGTAPVAPAPPSGGVPGGGGGGPITVPVRLLKTIIGDAPGVLTVIEDIPAALTELDADGRFFVDLTSITSAFLTVVVNDANGTAGELRVQYLRPSDSTWRYLDGSAGPAASLATAGDVVGASVTLEADAQGPRWCRLVSISGDGADDPVIGHVALHGGAANASVWADWQQLIQQLGGDSEVPFFYDGRFNVTPATGGKASAIDDVRGSSGYGPQLGSAFTADYPLWDSSSGVLTFGDGGLFHQAFTSSSASSLVDLSGPFTIIYVGTVDGTGDGDMVVAGVGSPVTTATTYLGVHVDSSHIVGGGLASASLIEVDGGVAVSTSAVRCVVVSQDGSTALTLDIPNDTQATGTLAGAMTPTSAYISMCERTSGETGNRGNAKVRAMIGVNHVLSAVELAAVIAWAEGYRSATRI